MAAIGEIAVNVVARTGGFSSGISRAQKDLKSFKSSVSSSIASLTRLLGIGGSFAGLGFAVKLAADAEQARTSFETMLGSADAAIKMVEDLRTLAASTPLQLTDLQNATRTLLAFGVAGDEVVETLRMLGDTAGGDAERLRSMALAFGQISSAGRLTGQDLLQLINAGFNPLREIAKRTGETMSDLKDRMSKGAVGVDEVRQAFQDATGPGGQFFQLMEKQSQTLTGRLSTLKDNVSALMVEFGEALLPVIGKVVDAMTNAVRVFSGMSDGNKRLTLLIGGTVAAFGGTLLVLPKLAAAFRILQGLYTALITRQVILQALSGPKGWAVLAVGVGVAAAALVGLNEALKDTNAETAKAFSSNPNGTPNISSRAIGGSNIQRVQIVGDNRDSETNKTLQQTNRLLEGIGGDVQDIDRVGLAAGF